MSDKSVALLEKAIDIFRKQGLDFSDFQSNGNFASANVTFNYEDGYYFEQYSERLNYHKGDVDSFVRNMKALLTDTSPDSVVKEALRNDGDAWERSLDSLLDEAKDVLEEFNTVLKKGVKECEKQLDKENAVVR